MQELIKVTGVFYFKAIKGKGKLEGLIEIERDTTNDLKHWVVSDVEIVTRNVRGD